MKNSTVNASTKFIWTLRRVRRSNKSCEMWIWRERDHIFRIYHNRRRDEIASRTLLTPFSKHRTLSNICEGTSKSLTSTDVSYKSTQPNLQLFNDLLKGAKEDNAPIEWSEQIRNSFSESERVLADVTRCRWCCNNTSTIHGSR